jgi:hypothetical protein
MISSMPASPAGWHVALETAALGLVFLSPMQRSRQLGAFAPRLLHVDHRGQVAFESFRTVGVKRVDQGSQPPAWECRWRLWVGVPIVSKV